MKLLIGLGGDAFVDNTLLLLPTVRLCWWRRCSSDNARMRLLTVEWLGGYVGVRWERRAG